MNCNVCSEAQTPTESIVARGRGAVAGCVDGIARVVLDPKDVQFLTPGEILVTPMTDPDCVPSMNIASAVLTDRGGLLCHAAVVCRELRKPCIVGTANATVQLRTGMRIRVCANRGVVIALSP
jgi:pyruvate,water dikinase